MQQAKAHSVTPEKIACGESLLRREGKGYSLWAAGKKGWDALWNCWKAQERRIAKNEIKKIIIQSAARKEHRQGEVLGGVLGRQGQVEKGRQGEVMSDDPNILINRELSEHGTKIDHLHEHFEKIEGKVDKLVDSVSALHSDFKSIKVSAKTIVIAVSVATGVSTVLAAIMKAMMG